MASGESSIFERIGGFEAILAAVDIFYDKVTADDSLAHFFTSLDMEAQQQKMVSFMAWAFGGPEEYKGRDLREAHKGLVERHGLDDRHFDAVAGHLQATLQELQVESDLIAQVMTTISGTRDAVLGR